MVVTVANVVDIDNYVVIATYVSHSAKSINVAQAHMRPIVSRENRTAVRKFPINAVKTFLVSTETYGHMSQKFQFCVMNFDKIDYICLNRSQILCIFFIFTKR